MLYNGMNLMCHILNQASQWLSVRRRQWHPTPVLLPGGSHGWRSLVGCSPWGCYKSDTTQRLHFHFSLARIGEGNGNPLQCSCLENPRDGEVWWAALYGVAQSRTRLKRLSSSSGSVIKNLPSRQETRVQSLGQEDPLEEDMATHSRILAWKIPQRQELARLWGHKESDLTEQQQDTGLSSYFL